MEHKSRRHRRRLQGYDKLAMPEGGVTLYAVYGDTYTVSYDANGGTGSAPADTKTYLEGERLPPERRQPDQRARIRCSGNGTTKADGTGDAYPSGGSIVIGTEKTSPCTPHIPRGTAFCTT